MSETRQSRYFKVLPYINFTLSLLIVFHHSFNVDVNFDVADKTISWVVERYLYNLSECAVPVFFFVSAMLFYRNYDGTKTTYVNKLKKRVISLVVPYVIFNILGYIKHIVMSHESMSLVAVTKSVIVSDTMPLWFLRELMILVLIAPFIYFVKNHKILLGVGTSLIFILVAAGIVQYREFLYWMPVYCLGTVFNMEDFKNKFGFMLQCKVVTTGLIALYLIMAWILPNTTSEMNCVGNIVFYIFRLYSILIATIVLGILNEKKIRKAPEYMNYSFWVYCVHFPIISLYVKMFEKIFLVDSTSFELFEYFSTVVIVYSGAVLLAMILKKCMPCLWKILNGGRE